ncbi:MAG TPA: DUF169 domain-containing protein [Candidatus Hydrogenedentes bacterium]|nr:DUF169 domain-containing protein [Candidatus Hydrogenedentota bacterium]
MEIGVKDLFIRRWESFVPNAPLPIAFFYTDDPGGVSVVPKQEGHACFLAQLGGVRKGEPLAFERESLGCSGGKRYLGFSQELMPGFEYFLSCGIPGKLEGERYKQSPELVREFIRNSPAFTAPARYAVFKRWDTLDETDEPVAVFFDVAPDVLAALFTLANYDEPSPHGVIAPFCAGCGAIVGYPYMEAQSEHPRAVLGMFDISARPFVRKETLSFAIPMKKFMRMMANMEESFLITDSWQRVRNRL